MKLGFEQNNKPLLGVNVLGIGATLQSCTALDSNWHNASFSGIWLVLFVGQDHIIYRRWSLVALVEHICINELFRGFVQSSSSSECMRLCQQGSFEKDDDFDTMDDSSSNWVDSDDFSATNDSYNRYVNVDDDDNPLSFVDTNQKFNARERTKPISGKETDIQDELDITSLFVDSVDDTGVDGAVGSNDELVDKEFSWGWNDSNTDELDDFAAALDNFEKPDEKKSGLSGLDSNVSSNSPDSTEPQVVEGFQDLDNLFDESNDGMLWGDEGGNIVDEDAALDFTNDVQDSQASRKTSREVSNPYSTSDS